MAVAFATPEPKAKPGLVAAAYTAPVVAAAPVAYTAGIAPVAYTAGYTAAAPLAYTSGYYGAYRAYPYAYSPYTAPLVLG